MLNVSRILYSPHFNQGFTIHRKTGAWDRGRWVETEQAIPFTGIVKPATAKELQQFPEADRPTSLIAFYAEKEMFLTESSQQHQGTSDVAEWRGKRYRLIKVDPDVDYGFCRAYGDFIGRDEDESDPDAETD